MKPSNLPVSLGVVGCGFIFRAIYSPILQALDSQVRVAAVCDPGEQALAEARRTFPGAAGYENSDAMLRSEKLDAVMILTKERFNASESIRALEAGVPVYLEKPPAAAMEDLEALIHQEEETGIPVFAAFNRRFTPLFQNWRPPQSLSKVRGVMARTGRDPATFPYTAIHLIDAMEYFSGRSIQEIHVFPTDRDGIFCWSLRGRLQDGIPFELVVIPDGRFHDETLWMESSQGLSTLTFPNPEGKCPRGRLVFEAIGSPQIQKEGPAEQSKLVAMGFQDAFVEFLQCLTTKGFQNTAHRLPRCRTALAAMEEMMPQFAPLRS